MKKYLIPLLMGFLFLSACGFDSSSTTEKEQTQQSNLLTQAYNEVGMPAITNFQEKRTLKNILELRDKQISTVTYIVDWNARLHKVCDSIGYGIPYATQYTNPMRLPTYGDVDNQHIASNGLGVTLPQADPNGLYSPADAEGTWVMCLNPVTKQLAPIYIEPRIIVSPFPLDPK